MVKHHIFHFSPWVALGLPREPIPTVGQAQKAFKRAALHCHPDQRSRFKIPVNRWPTIDHLKDSLDYFVDLREKGVLSTLYPPNNFAEFPETFHPRYALGHTGVYTEACGPGFFTCTICCMVMKTASKDEHLTFHHLSTCQFCDEIISTDHLLEHYHHQHDIYWSDIENPATYIRDYHTCPYCHRCFTGLQAHVDSEHNCDCRTEDEAWEEHITTQHTCCHTYHRDMARHCQETHQCRCQGFKDHNEFVDHVRRKHICPYCGGYNADLARHISFDHFCRYCDERQDDLPEHVEASHKCTYCFDLAVDLEHHIQTTHLCHECGEIHSNLGDHLKSTHLCEKCATTHANVRSHLRKHCDKCDFVAQDPAASLLKHLFETHRLAVCAHCDLTTPLTQHFWKHMNESHTWVPCPLCEILIDKEYVDYHLAQSHEWVRCKTCPDTTSLDAKDHLATLHATQSCKYCPRRFSKSVMTDHLLKDHNGKRCPYCDEVDQETPLSKHIRRIHQPRNCPQCDGEFPACELFAHSQTVHSSILCPYCYYFGSESDIEQHESQCHIRCEDCAGRYSSSQLRTHRREVHSWKDCPDCDAQYQPTQSEEHKKDHGLLQCPFPNCVGSPIIDTLATHIHRKHSMASCPFCDACTEDLEAHISNHVSEYDQSDPCPDCGEKCEEVHFFAHALRHRIRPGHGSARRIEDSAKAGEDLTPQQFEELLKNFLGHCQGQAASWLQRQQQPEIAHVSPSQEAADNHANGNREETSIPDAKNSVCEKCKREHNKSNIARHRKTCKGLPLGNTDKNPPSKRRRI
ncbi:hypothetical protein HD806DRAFT_119877 [Xylariaceae sp. AK1471]|nr:hypothetical protein HD806DRAFT_119877 [Xylariaceae sp. AK1471]